MYLDKSCDRLAMVMYFFMVINKINLITKNRSISFFLMQKDYYKTKLEQYENRAIEFF